jgi:ectoine hydroxylase-related dioxygenase (phytanoyl-CoA dioxygenase family)
VKVNRDQFMEQGFFVMHEVIPPSKLEAIRASCETILDRQKVIWARDRQPGDPPGGVYETSRQPRVIMEDPGLIDEETANVVEDFWVADETLDIASQLLCNPEPNVTNMMMMCNPVTNHPGGTGWHRDVHVEDMAPMGALAADFIENGPRYTQWNVPLYDDSVLWVVPGSHRRLNTDEENAELLADITKAPGGNPVELKAGDGVIYSNFLIHTGSNYSTNKRRTLHGGHAIFGDYPELGFIEHLSPAAREIFEESARNEKRKEDLTEAALRAVINRDVEGFRNGLEALQPGAGPSGKTVLTIYLAKAALHIKILKDSKFAAEVLPESVGRANSYHSITLNWGPPFADRFSPEEANTLWERFGPFDDRLKSDTDNFLPAYQSRRPIPYVFAELPGDMDTESFLTSWANG